MEKKGVSPVIATVLLIAMVIVLAMIIFIWFQGMTQEAITKFDENVELVCLRKVQFDAEYNSGNLIVKNTGTTPIYRMNLKTESTGEYSTNQIKTESEGGFWPNAGLNQQDIFSASINLASYESITLIPVLVGNTQSGGKAIYACKENSGIKLKI